ncbi:GNAT family N-acetyltransferase [Burkholderia glumae]|uniref:GNAT family N-acetyltransferase n=1 Tax=Burkholderia glumae TaxID=337 RepID=A0AAP9XW19_BURGL|nr:GNAT family N-acetyltransferase [Burkholderia glumae]ACR31392.1 GNAT family acetyltransferase [Burkholderia glumae BGR1]AJY64357.1 acetyltransferase domain protein [Burkholderia glumae LMG 2196 = ATCC 33617]KHJ61716.1 acetyltransferase [Burkholderia glumae]MCM2485449.1 GNAT family N-acetyltransferase [Burkholderia glumae]MCM2495857.1 GNAT family N-acetyltransferase [Burkholderia glumae]
MRSLQIRAANPADLPALRELFLHTRRETFVWQAAEAFALDDFDAQTRDELLLLAEDETGRLLGFVSVWEPTDFIHHLFVAAGHLRNGVGRALLNALPGWPGRRYQLKCLSRNHAALAFYRACGFSEAGSGSGPEGDYLLLESGGKVTP